MPETPRSLIAVGHAHPLDPERVAHARSRGLSSDDGARLAGTLSLLADPTRLRLLCALDVAEELCVGDLCLAVGLTEDAVGYALRLLRTAGLVTARKDGRAVFYRLAADFPAPLRESCLRQLVAMTRSADADAEV